MVRTCVGGDDIVSGGAGCGGVGFVVDERLVRGGLGDTVDTVGRQRGQVVLRQLPFRVVWPVSAVRTISGLPPRSVRDDACCIDAEPSRKSSMKLPRDRAVDELARYSSRERGCRLP
jgi:hypothetical protein